MRPVSLDDKYTMEEGEIFLSGAQAIVRLALDQHRRDAAAGLHTAGFISGYRGSPLGGVDTALWRADRFLAAHDIHFEPGLNEEIAATAVAGSQQAAIVGRSRFDGIFGIWYAKNPGVDRAADALKHGNAAGSAPHGGVLAISGDDPGASSSSLPNQCDQAFIAALVPVLSPANLAELVELGLLGIALSRYAGLWVGIKAVADVVECTGSIAVRPAQPAFTLPDDLVPPGGLGVRWPDERREQDARLLDWRLPAAKAFARANRIDRISFGAQRRPRLVIVAAGKAHGDVREALRELGIDGTLAAALGLAVYKVGMVWPLEATRIRAVIEGAEDVLLVEERRAVIEPQLKDLAFNWPADRRPRIVGKHDEHGARLLPEGGELSPPLVARAIAARLERLAPPSHVLDRARAIGSGEAQASITVDPDLVRLPHFCAGCPHARSTRLPEGSVGIAGIGCHSLRVWMPESQTVLMPQMGGEGASWLGIAPFVESRHVFQNLGDGTYAHSGSLAIRAAVAAKRPITFRILYNEATAMTGGQPVEGALTVEQIARLVAAEGVERIAIVSDQPEKHRGLPFPSVVTIHHRDELDALQRELRDRSGVSAIIYDQVCATEKRRRRKRGLIAEPSARPFINTRVCEGCGDCVERSQCAAVLPVETSFGRKRRIDQSACNVDLSCLDGFCPSFVTVEGGELRRAAPAEDPPEPPLPPVPVLSTPCDILIVGIGGTGVITVSALLGMAAHLSGIGCTLLDNTGIARKGGAVTSDVRLAPRPEEIHVARIPDRKASLVLAGDLVTAATPAVLAKIEPGRSRVIGNATATPTLKQRLALDGPAASLELRDRLIGAAGSECCEFVDTNEIAEHLLGDSIYSNMVLLGFAYQRGLIPLPCDALGQAIALNGTEVDANRRAFAWGRRAAHDAASVARALQPFREEASPGPGAAAGGRASEFSPAAEDGTRREDLDFFIAGRSAYLVDYQDAAYAQRYLRLVARVRQSERARGRRDDALAWAVASGYFRLLAVKDEYEVARLYSDGEFARALQRQFSGQYRIRYHLAPPLLARPDPVSGRVRKRSYGAWMGRVLRLLVRLKPLRGSWLDPFGYTGERRMERRLVKEYEATIERLLDAVEQGDGDYRVAAEIAGLPEQIRGYGHVKAASIARAKTRETELLASLRSPPARAA
jgi:indolepyruvate ferredoxin oxidoreductase